MAAHARPEQQLLFAIVQGGLDPDLRLRCIQGGAFLAFLALIAILAPVPAPSSSFSASSLLGRGAGGVLRELWRSWEAQG